MTGWSSVGISDGEPAWPRRFGSLATFVQVALTSPNQTGNVASTGEVAGAAGGTTERCTHHVARRRAAEYGSRVPLDMAISTAGTNGDLGQCGQVLHGRLCRMTSHGVAKSGFSTWILRSIVARCERVEGGVRHWNPNKVSGLNLVVGSV